jgi:benzoyl-CoA reductase/2-hydroxyglutaryl-CoA dehydratase subunit BcrC/BadD/HgdB
MTTLEQATKQLEEAKQLVTQAARAKHELEEQARLERIKSQPIPWTGKDVNDNPTISYGKTFSDKLEEIHDELHNHLDTLDDKRQEAENEISNILDTYNSELDEHADALTEYKDQLKELFDESISEREMIEGFEDVVPRKVYERYGEFINLLEDITNGGEIFEPDQMDSYYEIDSYALGNTQEKTNTLIRASENLLEAIEESELKEGIYEPSIPNTK